MAKRIGILGGLSYESTIKYYELILKKYFGKYQNYHYPEIVIFSLDFQKFTDFENSDNRKGYIEYILSGIKALEKQELILLSWQLIPHTLFLMKLKPKQLFQ